MKSPQEHHAQPVIFSAHGVAKSVPADAEARNLFYLDATCPLVSKVHKQAMRHERLGRHVVLIGHKGHPEVIGTMGQLPPGAVTLVETVEDVDAFEPEDPAALGFVTQTTLSVDDTADVIERLNERFPEITAPAAESICYATTNRQDAVKQAAPGCDLFVVVGAPNSSNSKRLVEVALKAGAKTSDPAAARPRDRLGCHRRHPPARPVRRCLCARGGGRRDHRGLQGSASTPPSNLPRPSRRPRIFWSIASFAMSN
jgi:4-hydroxy-3-methylbut-2-enyl diphosphate reductase